MHFCTIMVFQDEDDATETADGQEDWTQVNSWFI